MNKILVNILVVLFCTYLKSNAQEAVQKAPNLFDKYPTELHINSAEIFALLKNNANDIVAVHSADGSVFNGHVMQNKKYDEYAQTISVELKDFPAGTKLIVNRIIRDGKTVYRAHILNHKNPDAYILKTYDEHEFIFVKTAKEKIVTD